MDDYLLTCIFNDTKLNDRYCVHPDKSYCSLVLHRASSLYRDIFQMKSSDCVTKQGKVIIGTSQPIVIFLINLCNNHGKCRIDYLNVSLWMLPHLSNKEEEEGTCLCSSPSSIFFFSFSSAPLHLVVDILFSFECKSISLTALWRQLVGAVPFHIRSITIIYI
jgi:hypothetical protein